jgi:hypothetical protein
MPHMKNIALLLGLALCLTLAPWAYGWEAPGSIPLMPVSFPLDLAIIDPDATGERPPFVVMFPNGIDKNATDVRGPVGRLKALRGASKMFPESNQDPGLPVVLRGLRFHQKVDAKGAVVGYEVELQGEFNTVRVPAHPQDVNSFLSGQRTTFRLAAQKNYGLYAYVSSMQLDVQLQGNDVFIFGIEGDFTLREGLRTYASQTKKLSPPTSRPYLYRGHRATLPTLPTI